mmetsp:Transcript_38227/g.75791  ORF Transcript_38227/g.75791 Transcript_38227/m.75791 type:complete len:92 (+) Transcript_38227:457-732(+)
MVAFPAAAARATAGGFVFAALANAAPGQEKKCCKMKTAEVRSGVGLLCALAKVLHPPGRAVEQSQPDSTVDRAHGLGKATFKVPWVGLAPI